MERGLEEDHDPDTRLEVDVAVIGNGPSGIALSYMLSGHWPYFTGDHPNPYLTQKLNQAPLLSLLHQDLEELSDGLEGRSKNPVSVLFDTLVHPNADIGQDRPSALTWIHDPSRTVPHVVIGSGKPGGSWHRMQPDLETVSLGHWLELPGYSFNRWKMEEVEQNRESDVNSAAPTNETVMKRKRVLLGEVAQYYDDYVAKMGLEKNFLNGVEVVCAMDLKRSKVKKPPPILESQSQCSSSSRLSSLSSSPGPYSPSHATSMTSAELLRNLREDVGYQHLADSDLEEHFSIGTAAGDNLFRVVNSEPSVKEVEDHTNHESGKQANTSPEVPSPSGRGTGVCEGLKGSDAVSFQIRPFPADSEPRQIECFPETSCCCVSDPDDSGVYCLDSKKLKPDYRWCIRGRWKSSQDGSAQGGRCVKILAKKLVLACGVGQHRKLGIPGEDLPFIRHQYSDLVPAVDSSAHSYGQREPILVVGAGLSAADAVLLALKRGLRVIHSFYQDADDSGLIFHKMPPSMYREYRHVFGLMQGKTTNDNYTPLPKHRVVEFKPGGTCRLKSTNNDNEVELKVSLCHVLIGNEADLSFLPQRLTSTLGIKADSAIHPKLNPIDIHPYTYQSESVPSLYAVGPLVGDNFVRFALGGALGVTHHIILNNSRSKDV